MLINKCPFSFHFLLVSAHCVCNLFLSYSFFFRKKRKFYVYATERLRQGGKNETKSIFDKNMRRYLLLIKKGSSSVDEKIAEKRRE